MSGGLLLPRFVEWGVGVRHKLPEMIKKQKVERLLLLTDEGVFGTGLITAMTDELKQAGMDLMLIADVPSEPDVEAVLSIFNRARGFAAQAILAVGGGSVMDVSKLVSALSSNPSFAGNLLDASLIVQPPIATYMLPTTAGTGAEVTRNAIVLDRVHQVKVGVVCPGFLPQGVLLDPELTRTLPASITASTGVDALCHAIECFISTKGNAVSHTVALGGIQTIFRYLATSCRDGGNIEAREQLLLAAFGGGVCINTASTTAVHALSYPLGGRYHIPHGVANAMLLYPVLKDAEDVIAPKLALIADALGLATGMSEKQKAEQVLDAMKALLDEIHIPMSIQPYGITPSDVEAMAREAYGVRRLLDCHPKALTIEDIKRIYMRLFPEEEG